MRQFRPAPRPAMSELTDDVFAADDTEHRHGEDHAGDWDHTSTGDHVVGGADVDAVGGDVGLWRPPAPATTPPAHAPDMPAFRRRSSVGEAEGVRAWAGCGGSSVVINNLVVNLCTFTYSFKCFHNHELNCLIQLSVFGCSLFYSILFYIFMQLSLSQT